MIAPAQTTSRRPRRASARLAAVLATAVVGLVAACVDGRSPTALDLLRTASLAIVPSFETAAAIGTTAGALPINRIRITVRPVGVDSVILVDTTDVNPTDTAWSVELEVPLDAGATASFQLTFELINVAGDGTETVEWSAQAEKTVTQGATNTVSQPATTRGPIANLSVDSVVAAAAPRSTLIEGDTVRLTAVTHGGGDGARHYWGSLDPTLASVDQSGLVTTLLPGLARIAAVAGPKADTISLTVVQSVAGIAFVPDTARIASIGDSATIVMSVIDPRGDAVPDTDVEYTLLAGTAAEDLGDGRFLALANGTQRVAARGFRVTPIAGSSGPALTNVADTAVMDTATVVVQQVVAGIDFDRSVVEVGVSDTTTVVATPVDAFGVAVGGAAVTWSSSNTGVVTVSASGLVTGVALGSTWVKATSGTVTDSVAVSVVALVPATVTVTPSTSTLLTLGAQVTLGATAYDINGTPIAGRTFTWSSSNTAVATVNASGVVTAGGNGTTTVTASTGGISGTSTITVNVPVGSIDVTPDFRTIAAGSTAALTGTTYDASGAVLTGVTVGWASTNAAVATVNTSGVATGAGVGVAGVVGSASGKADTATVAVADAATLVSTAFAAGGIRSTARAGDTVTVTVKLDMSFVGTTGDLGSAEFVLSYDPAVLTFVSAASGLTAGTGLTNNDQPGRVAFAMASTSAQASTDVTMMTAKFVVASVTVGTVSELDVSYESPTTGLPVAPTNIDGVYYTAPLSIGGRIRVIS